MRQKQPDAADQFASHAANSFNGKARPALSRRRSRHRKEDALTDVRSLVWILPMGNQKSSGIVPG